MNGHAFEFAGTRLVAQGSGALWWPEQRLLCVSDLHLGKSERMARRGGAMLPPYEVRDTLARLERDIEAADPARVVCLGDSFDDVAAAGALEDAALDWIARLQAGRNWVWIVGNHDPAPVALGGALVETYQDGPLTFRHIAAPAAQGEVSGHYHPKAALSLRGRQVTRRCFLHDASRLIMPAYGTYTGGLRWTDPVFGELLPGPGRAILTGQRAHAVPLPRSVATG